MVAKFLSDEAKKCALGIEKRKSTNLEKWPPKDVPKIFEQLLMLLVTGEREGYVRKSNKPLEETRMQELFRDNIWGGLNTLGKPLKRGPTKDKLTSFAKAVLEDVKNHEVQFTKETHETDPENSQSSVAKNEKAQNAGVDGKSSCLGKRTHNQAKMNKSKGSEEEAQLNDTDIRAVRKSSAKSSKKDHSSKTES